jgi:hypothetical protein
MDPANIASADFMKTRYRKLDIWYGRDSISTEPVGWVHVSLTNLFEQDTNHICTRPFFTFANEKLV